MMFTAKHIGRIGALALALGVGVTAVAAPVSPRPAVTLSANTTALIFGGTTVPKWDEAGVEVIMNQFIEPTHPGVTEHVAVASKGESWPLTGALRVIGLAVGDPRVFGPGGPAWPDEPWWKLSGLFDLTFDQSVQAGAADLEAAMAENGNDHLVIYGLSQGAVVANVVKTRLAAQYPAETTKKEDAPDISFVLAGDANLPNGGLFARLPGLYIPVLDWTFNGPEPTDTLFHTDVVTIQYDGSADFPLYVLNVVADLNAVLGFVYLHTNSWDVSLAADASTTPPTVSKHGDSTYYFFESQDLPLFAPLRMLGVPEKYIDVVEPFFRVIVEQGYDRSIPPWEPTPARLVPRLNPANLADDLVDAIGKGVTNARALIDPPQSLNAGEAADLTALEQHPSTPDTTARKNVGRDIADHFNNAIGAVKSAIEGNGRTILPTMGSDNDSPTAHLTRTAPLHDVVAKARADVKKVVTQVSDTVKKALGRAKTKDAVGPESNSVATP